MSVKKLTVQFGEPVAEVLKKLADGKGISQVEVLRRAVALYSYAEQQSELGYRLAITNREGQRVADVVLT